MRIQFTEEQIELRSMVRKWLDKELEPRLIELDEKNECPMDLVQQGFEMGLHLIDIPEEYGGLGLGPSTATWVYEEMAKTDDGFAGCFSTSATALTCVLSAGNDEQKKRAMDIIVPGAMAAFCLTEPGAGSDNSIMTTRAVKDGDSYILNGRKCFITNGGVSDLYIVMAVTDPEKGFKGVSAFMIEKDTPGLSFGRHENKMGSRLSPTCDVVMEDCRVPAANLLGPEGTGFTNAMASLEGGRIVTAAGALGMAERALEEALKYSRQRVQFGQPIAKHQAIAFMLADMEIMIEASARLIDHALYLQENDLPFNKEASIAKCFATDTAVKVTSDAMQILGGYGYMKDYPLEKLFRDARLYQIIEGTNQIQRRVISKEIIGRI